MDHNAHRGSYGVLVIQSPTSASIHQDFLAGSTVTTPTTPTNPELNHATAAELTKINEQEVKFKGHVYKVQVPKVSTVRSKYVDIYSRIVWSLKKTKKHYIYKHKYK